MQAALVVGGRGGPGPAGDAEQEAEPVLTVAAEAGPGDRAGQLDHVAVDAGLLANLAAQAAHGVLVQLELAAEAVVLAVVEVVGTGVAAHHQHLVAAGRKHVTEGRDDRLHGCDLNNRDITDLAIGCRDSGHYRFEP